MPNQRKSLSDWESLKCLDTSTKKGKAPGISKRIIMKKNYRIGFALLLVSIAKFQSETGQLLST